MTLNHQDPAIIRAERDARVTEWSATDMSLARMGVALGISLGAVRHIRKRLGLAPRAMPPNVRRKPAIALTGPYTLGDGCRANLPAIIPPAGHAVPPPPDDRPKREVRLTMRPGNVPTARTVMIPAEGTLPDIIRYHDRLFLKGRGTTYREASRMWPVFDELDAVA